MEIRLLGPVEVIRDGTPVARLTGRPRALLAVLALAAPEPVTADAIGRRVWGDDPPENLRPSVQSLVFRLRRLLGPEPAIEYAGSSYALRIAPEQVDASRFQQLLEAAARAGDPREQHDRLTEALALWRGEPFDGVDSEWLSQLQAPRLTETYLSAVERRLDLDLAAGNHEQALPELRELAAAHPLRESLWSRLLTVLAKCGRPAEALTQYEQLRRRLAEELGTDPDPQLRALYAELLAATQPRSPSAVGPAAMAPRQLPPAPAGFTGRATVLAELDRLSSASRPSSAPTIVAVHGPGGVGKTALALHWAHRAADRFPDGQLYLNLQGYGPERPLEPDAALDLLLRGLGVPGAQIPHGRQARAALLRSVLADRQVLIVLDNARNADQVRPLMPGSTGLVLVTSRSQLRSLAARDGAQRVPLEPFSSDDAAEYLTQTLTAYDVRHDAEELAELTRLCGHLPLALAIAAERLTREPESTVRALSAELEQHPDRLALLDVGEDADGALRAVLSWSYDVLSAQSARAFRVLGLLPGPDTSVEAVGALLAVQPEEARQSLGRLVGAHLLEQPGERYQLHDLLAEYAGRLVREVEDPADITAARERLLDWYAQSARNGKVTLEKSEPLLDFGHPMAGVEPMVFDTTRQAVDWFAAERQGLVAAMRTAVAHGHDRAAYRLGHALWPYFMYVRALDDLFEIQCLALDAARRTGDGPAEAVATHAVGRAYLFRPDLDQACKHLDEALRLFELLGDDYGRGSVLTDLGRLHRRRDDSEAAVRHHRAAIEVLTRLNDTVGVAGNHANVADTYLLAGRHHEAAAAAREAVRLNRIAGERRAEAFALDTLSAALLGRGDHADARRIAEEALELSRDLDDRWSEVCALTHLGRALQAVGDVPAAHRQWRRALEVLDETGMPGSDQLNRTTLTQLLAG
ncbi:BTAD domain-containing putative transcriptional regulator [Kribbella sp. NPDC003505]|uniref:AfsR/SARP family transcriptional regulator n=1 Tax=Kribbella sp. NPDC003505 TaxID=3154448 RepID=UPI0033AD6904